MADQQGYRITGSTGERLDKALRLVLGSGSSGGGSPIDATNAAETCWAKLTGHAGTTNDWEWFEVYPFFTNDDKLDWGTVTGGRKGDNTKDDALKNLAIELVKGTAVASSTVLLRRAFVRAKQASSSDPVKWLARWEIVAPIPAVAQVQCTDAMGNGSLCKAKVYSNISGLVGDEFEVQLQHITNVGQKFYAAYAGKNGYGNDTYVQLGLPPAKSKGMCLMIMDSQNNLGTVDWDFPKGHNQ